jgi:hypothetical protein
MNADKRRLISGLLGSVLLVVAAGAFAATPVPSGRWSFVFTDQKGRPDRPIRVFTYRPKQCDETCPIVIVLHGDDLWHRVVGGGGSARRVRSAPGRTGVVGETHVSIADLIARTADAATLQQQFFAEMML